MALENAHNKQRQSDGFAAVALGVSFKSNSIPISYDLLSHHNQQNERAQEKRHL